MFIDSAKIYIKAGKGGDGAVSFRREKYTPKGGPDGGDGGDGGSVIAIVDNHCHGLALFNRQKVFIAEDGQNGMSQKKHGKRGKDLVLLIPAGTQVFSNDHLIIDLTKQDDYVVLAKGGSGGFGNQHFATSIKQTPRWSKKGLCGEEKELRLELKLIADIGLIGLPNSGKSTLLSVISGAKPKIADYPFTTLEPNLGVIKGREHNIIVADIPGLIKGASKGKGLGHKFLKHIERTKVLVHLIDINQKNIEIDYLAIRNELKKFSKVLVKKKEIVVINKTDTLTEFDLKQKVSSLKRIKNPILLSSVSGVGLKSLLDKIKSEIFSL